jgi:hypothetical protein
LLILQTKLAKLQIATHFARRNTENCGGEKRGREVARPCVSKEAKPAKIVSLIVKDFCARPLKDLSIFAGFVRREAASPLGGMPRLRRGISQPFRSKQVRIWLYNCTKNFETHGVFFDISFVINNYSKIDGNF